MKTGGPTWKVIALLAVIFAATGWICFLLATAPEEDACGEHEETIADTNAIHPEHQH